MSETGGTRPDVEKLRWADQPGAYPKTEALPAKKDVGYDTDEIPPSEEWNWWRNFEGLIVAWLDGAHVREFSDIGEAVAAVSIPEVFRIGQPAAGNRSLGQQVYSLTPATFTQINDAVSDGGRAYYLDSSGAIFACNPDDGVQVWALTPANVTVNALAAAGAALYISGNTTAPGIVALDRDTGAEIGRDPSAIYYGYRALAANGDWVVAGSSTTANTSVLLYSTTVSPPLEIVGSLTNHGDQVDAVACDSSKFYFGGAGGLSSHDVRAYTLAASPALVWQTLFGTIGPAVQVNAIATDGSLVYVGTDNISLSGGGTANLFVLQASDGQVILELNVPGGAADNVQEIAVSAEGIFVTVDGATNAVVRMPFSPAFGAMEILGAVDTAYDADGVGLIATNGTALAERYFTQLQPVTFQRAGAGDPERRPFHKLALPLR